MPIRKISSAFWSGIKWLNLPPNPGDEFKGKTFAYITKVTGASTGGAGVRIGLGDMGTAIMCQDGVCICVSAVGLAADGIQLVSCFVAGPNRSIYVTYPISVGCKAFVWSCRKGIQSWAC